MHRFHCLLIATLLLLSPITALAGDHQWSGSGPFATGLGNRVITALALSSDGKQVYAGTGSGTVHHYSYTAPTATSSTATSISSSGATLNGSINAHNADATVSFEYGLTTAYGTSVGATPVTVSGATDTGASTSLSGLTPGATYHFRVVATNSSGTSYGSDLSFTVGKLNQTIGAVSFVPNSLVANGTTTASATASSGLAVTFTSTTPTVCTVSGRTVTGVTVGTCTIAGNQAGSVTYNAASLITQNISVGKGTASVALGSLSQHYDGTPQRATVTTLPAGLTVDFTYAGSATAPSAVGSYAVVGTINDANYQGSASGTLVINKATATVALGGLALTYDGSAKAATATTTPTGLTVGFTYDGSSTAPTAVGSYTVVGTINDANYQGSASGTLVVNKATATVALGGLAQTYDGSARAATATTTPTGLTVDFTYAGSATAPTAVGSYAVVGTINDVSYQGSANGTLVIAAVLVSHVTPSSGTGGSIIPATVQTVIDGGRTSFTLNVETGYQIDNVSGCGGSLTGSTYTTGIINSNCTVIASFVLIPDTTPPVLTLSTLPDGAVTRSADLNLAGMVRDDIAMGRLTINGIPVVIQADNSFSQLMTLVEGSNTLTTIATDAKGNSVTDIRSITLDSTAPSLTIMNPVDNSQTGTAILTVSGTIEAGALCDLVLNGESPLVATVSDTNYSLDITLNEGLNSIDVTGRDNLGNSTTQHRTITLDSAAPMVQITAPNADSTVSNSTLILEGSARDTTSAVSISLDIDGQIFTPPLDSNGHFSLNLALTEERTYVVVLTASDALGNQASVTRNLIYKRPYLWGDTNGDELVDVDDALLTLQIAVGIEPLQPKNLLRGDVAPLINGRPQPDGRLSAGDALIILRRAVGLVNW